MILFSKTNPVPRVAGPGKAKRRGIPCRNELPDAQNSLLVEKVRLDRRKRPDTASVPRQRHVALRPLEGCGDMGTEKASLSHPDFPHYGLEPAKRAREGKEDRAVHEENLGKGGGGPFLPRRHPPIVECAVFFARFHAEIPDPDPGYG
jgi:hypothetical protein